MLGYKIRYRYFLGIINFLNATITVFDVLSASSFISIFLFHNLFNFYLNLVII